MMAVSSSHAAAAPHPARDEVRDGLRDWAGRLGPLGLIGLAHAALLLWLTGVLSRPPVTVAPPSVVGELVSEAPAPKPLPMAPAPDPRPQPKPVARPRPVTPPTPQGPPSERAVPAPPPTPVTPPADSPAEVPAAPAPSTTDRSQDLPVTPPRSDASALNNPAPEYPRLSRSFHEQGHVLLDIYILPDGTVGQIRLHTSSGYARLDSAALDAVRRWHYIPARRGDEAIPYWYVQPIDFELNR